MAAQDPSATPHAGPGAAPPLNAAKAAFEDYRQRMSGAWGSPGYPPPPPPGISAWPYGQAPQPPQQFAPPAPAASGASLFAELATLLRLGVQLLNTGLQGGTQLMQGLYGTPGPSGLPAGGGCHSQHHSCGCHGHGHGHEGHHGHCLYSGHCCDPCHPGVHNCC